MGDPKASEARERLAILEETRDGFRIAAEDLRQGRPGEVLGTVQSGLPELTFAEFWQDEEMLALARSLAKTTPGSRG
jgi:ATP-dependent DNA helicase RecG